MGFGAKIMHIVSSNVDYTMVFGAASVGSLAQALRKGEDVTAKQYLGTAIHSGIWAILVYLWLQGSLDDTGKRAAISIMAGIGSHSFVELAMTFIEKRWGLSIVIRPEAPKVSDPVPDVKKELKKTVEKEAKK